MCAQTYSPSNPSLPPIRNLQIANRPMDKSYDYLLKFLLVGDSDVGKEELLSGMEDGASESPYGYASGGKYV